jgi:hypothetical protein
MKTIPFTRLLCAGVGKNNFFLTIPFLGSDILGLKMGGGPHL